MDETIPFLDGPRPCLPQELAEVVALANRVLRSGSPQDLRTDYPLVFNSERAENIRIIRRDGVLACAVPVVPREMRCGDDLLRLGIIGPTATHPAYRRQGLATRCLDDGIELMQRQSLALSLLWTVPPTFPFYENVGWQPAASQGWTYRLRAADEMLFDDGGSEIVVFDPGCSAHLEAVRSLHGLDPVRIVRSEDDFRALLTLPRIRTLLACRDGEIVAYLVLGDASNKSGLVEGGGEGAALADLVAHVLRSLPPVGELQAVVPLGFSALGDLLAARVRERRRPVEEAVGVGHQMIRVNSLEGFLRGIRCHLAKCNVHGRIVLGIEETGEAVALALDGPRVEIAPIESSKALFRPRAELTQLFFGVPAASPSPHWTWSDSEMNLLRRLFPCCLPIHELDHC